MIDGHYEVGDLNSICKRFSMSPSSISALYAAASRVCPLLSFADYVKLVQFCTVAASNMLSSRTRQACVTRVTISRLFSVLNSSY